MQIWSGRTAPFSCKKNHCTLSTCIVREFGKWHLIFIYSVDTCCRGVRAGPLLPPPRLHPLPHHGAQADDRRQPHQPGHKEQPKGITKGRWVAKLGRWVAKLGRWVAKLGRWVAKVGRWVAKVGRWVAKLGRWVAKVGRWVAKLGRWVAR